jgi:hypothetical protein
MLNQPQERGRKNMSERKAGFRPQCALCTSESVTYWPRRRLCAKCIAEIIMAMSDRDD